MSNEALIHWSGALELGLTIVDEEHKILVQLINELHVINNLPKNELTQKRDALLKRSLHGLAEYTQTHFVVEEEFMRVYKYPAADEHRRAHQAFVDRISSLMESVEDGGLDIPNSLMNFLKNWLSTHILEIDRKLVAFLISKGVH